MSAITSFIDSIRPLIKGDIHADPLHNGIYATDASMYQVVPNAVVYPRNTDDVIAVVNSARQHNVAILARGGGTSLAGQAVADAIVLDFTKYMHSVLEYNPSEKWMRVQPGITRDEVNLFAKNDRLEFAPDPATSSRATIGGMIANNSSGTKSILYGKTSDHVIDIKVLLSSGEIMTLGPGQYSPEDIQDIPGGNYLLELNNIVERHREEIISRFPKTMRRVNGYALDALLDKNPWNPHQIFIGSEGTLGVILEARIRLVALPQAKGLSVVQFHSTLEAVQAVQTMLGFNPAAIEILSEDLISYSRKNLETRSKCNFVEGDPESIQIVEFYGDTQEDNARRAEAMHEALQSKGLGYAFSFYPEGKTYDNVWDIRKKGLGLLLGEPADKRPIAFIEDAAIPVETLPEYIEGVMEICDRHGVRATYYAHASVGVIHVRPILDLREAGDIAKMELIAREVFQLVIKHGGAWSGEHGDGMVRSPFLEEFFGAQIYQVLREVKSLFDPAGIMNPGKIIDPAGMAENLRYGDNYQDEAITTVYKYQEQRDFHTAVHQCSGIGACRKMQGGTMCPSYMATREELHSTRGRANALRLAMSGQLSEKGLADPVLLEALDLCLSCKACKAECPSSVDMARLKSEVLQIQYEKNGVSRRDRLVRDSVKYSGRFSGVLAATVNRLQDTSIFRTTIELFGGFDKRRALPAYSSFTFKEWFKSNYADRGHNRRVGLFADTYLNYHEPQIGISAVGLIQALGWDIDLLEGCCQRPKISHGFLKEAIRDSANACNAIGVYDGEVLVCEPGCASAFTDDLPDLVDDPTLSENLKSQVMPIESWVARELEDEGTDGISAISNKVLLHGHCHQKALYGTKSIHSIFNMLGCEVIEPDSGCCGMAGSFGYEKEHYEISETLYERVLGKAIASNPELPVIASGFSCRHQIDHFGKRKAVHWLEALEFH